MSVSVLERGVAYESYPYKPEKNTDRLHLEDIEPLIDSHIFSVALHEFTHIGAIWGVGASTSGATVEPTSEYAGATFHSGEMSVVNMQIAAMASADHKGKGFDQMKAYILQYYGGIPMKSAEAIAKSILSSYRKDVMRGAAAFLAYYGHASDSELRQFMRWAEEDISNKKKYKGKPISSWSDELDERRKESEGTASNAAGAQGTEEIKENGVVRVTYHNDGTRRYTLTDGSEKVYCTHCHQMNMHKERCPNYHDGIAVFPPVMTPEQETFWRNQLNSIFEK